MKLEIALLAGADTKAFLVELTGLVERLEATMNEAPSKTKPATALPVESKKGKGAAKVKEVEENFDLEAGEDSESEESFDDAEEISDEAEKAPVLTKEDVVKALQAYSKKHDRDKAIGVIKKFAKTGAVKDVAVGDYPKLLKLLGA